MFLLKTLSVIFSLIAGKTKMLGKILIGIVVFLFLAAVILILVHRYYFAWSDNLSSCISKTAYIKREKSNPNFVTQKLDYFTAHKISYGFLRSDDFINPIKNNLNYKVEYQRDYTTKIIRNFNGGEYRIDFEYVWRTPDPKQPQAIIYDGAGVKYSITEECGVPYYQMEKNLRQMISELPVAQELSAEIDRKLSLEFSTNRNLIKIGF